MSGLVLLAPDFALIALGALLMRYGRFDTGFWIGVERLVYFILFPALLFHSIVRTPFDFAKTGALVEAEYRLLNFYRQFELPEEIDADRIGAELKHGVLTLQLPKKEKAKPRKIDVSVA